MCVFARVRVCFVFAKERGAGEGESARVCLYMRA